MVDFGVKLAYGGIAIGLLLFVGFLSVRMLGPIGAVVYFAAFIFCYLALPTVGLAYDLKFREDYKP